jgi:predicted DNA-binding transcriptional regulator AlpA
MLVDDDSPFLTIDETAALLRIKRRTLDNLRWRKDGPPARRHGGRIVYHRREVLEWSERRGTRAPPAGETRKVEPRHNGGARPPRGRSPAVRRATPPPKRKP